MSSYKGKLVVIDGIDGAGKTTQVELLKQYLASQGLPATLRVARRAGVPLEAISFPRYEDNLYGKLIRRYLSGESGSIQEVNPYLMACIFAGDRVLAKPLIESWLSEGKLVIANRYVSASKAHLSANLPEGKREEFIGWLDELEYETNKMPKEDLTILLNVDPKTGQENVKGEHRDIHEQDLKHLEQAARIYLELSKAEENWKVIKCMENGQMRTPKGIHHDLLRLLTMILS